MISKEYLENEVCMSAILELKKDDDYRSRMILIVHDNANISTNVGPLAYIQYWKNQHDELDALCKTVSIESVGSFGEELIKLRNINNEIAGFIRDIRNRYTMSLAELRKTNYAPIVQYVLK